MSTQIDGEGVRHEVVWFYADLRQESRPDIREMCVRAVIESYSQPKQRGGRVSWRGLARQSPLISRDPLDSLQDDA